VPVTAPPEPGTAGGWAWVVDRDRVYRSVWVYVMLDTLSLDGEVAQATLDAIDTNGLSEILKVLEAEERSGSFSASAATAVTAHPCWPHKGAGASRIEPISERGRITRCRARPKPTAEPSPPQAPADAASVRRADSSVKGGTPQAPSTTDATGSAASSTNTPQRHDRWIYVPHALSMTSTASTPSSALSIARTVTFSASASSAFQMSSLTPPRRRDACVSFSR